MIGVDIVPDIYNSDTIEIFELAGRVLTIIKYSVVLVLIAYSVFDFYKAIISKESDSLKKGAKRFGLRVVAATLIFYLPTVVLFSFESIGFKKTKWIDCVLDTNKCIISDNTNNNGDNNSDDKDNNSDDVSKVDCSDFIVNTECISDIIFYE